MSIRLVAIDLDDTLLTDDLVITPRTQRAIATALAAGVHIVPATGRMFPAARKYAVQLGLTGPLITYNGGMIKSAAGETWWHKPLPQPLALELLDFALADGWPVQCYCDDRLYVHEINEEVRFYTEIAGVPAQRTADMRSLIGEVAPTKMLGIGPPKQIRRRAEKLRSHFGSRVAVTISKPQYVEMLRPDISKAAALAEVTRRLHVAQNEVLAIGDSFNDLEMLAWAGVGVAVENGHPDVKAVADHVVASNTEDGVAEALERFVLI